MIKIRNRNPKRVRWGVIGLGRFSETAILPALQNVRKAKIASVYSKNSLRAKNIADKFSVPFHTNDFAEFLKSDIDAVYIGSSNNDHYSQVLAAAAAGKHILCDKPLALSSEQAEEMVAVCKKNNVQLAVNYIYRFHPLLEKAKELISKQTIGKIISISTNFNIHFPPDNNFRFSKELSGGGVMRDLATHMLDLMRFLYGEVEPVSCIMDNIIYRTEVEDFASGQLKFNNGGYAYFCVSSNCLRALNRIEIVGNRGSISIENLIGGRFSSAKMSILLEGEGKKVFRKRTNKLHIALKSFNNSFLRNTTPVVTGEDGLVNLLLLEKLEKYAAEKRVN